MINAHASVNVSNIRLANAGGVNTSSLERFIIHVNTSRIHARTVYFVSSLMNVYPLCIKSSSTAKSH